MEEIAPQKPNSSHNPFGPARLSRARWRFWKLCSHQLPRLDAGPWTPEFLDRGFPIHVDTKLPGGKIFLGRTIRFLNHLIWYLIYLQIYHRCTYIRQPTTVFFEEKSNCCKMFINKGTDSFSLLESGFFYSFTYPSLFRSPNYITQTLNVWYIYLYLPTKIHWVSGYG